MTHFGEGGAARATTIRFRRSPTGSASTTPVTSIRFIAWFGSRIPSLALAFVALSLGIHAAEPAALRVWEIYDEHAVSFDDLTVVYVRTRLGFACLMAATLAGAGFLFGRWLGPRLRGEAA